jgi:ADP-ribose pyrophosphatase YjhB (NUDIX family)
MSGAEYYKNLPKKRMAAGALLFDADGKLLILKPTYKDHWSIPGGVIEANESPREACVREIEEEVGLKIKNLKFLCVDYHRNEGNETGESLQFMFGAMVPLSADDVAAIRLQESEIGEYKFSSTHDALEMVGERLGRRIRKCLSIINGTGTAGLYLEEGEK